MNVVKCTKCGEPLDLRRLLVTLGNEHANCQLRVAYVTGEQKRPWVPPQIRDIVVFKQPYFVQPADDLGNPT